MSRKRISKLLCKGQYKMGKKAAYKIKETKFGFFTDSHFSVIRQDFRTDSFFDSVLSKMKQAYSHFEKEGCEFVLFGGDFFDKYASNSRYMLQTVREVLVSSKLKTYFIIGQHDLAGYSEDSYKGSNLAFLENICDGKIQKIHRSIDLGNLHIYSSHVFQNPEEVLSSIPKTLRKPVVVLAHSLLCEKASFPGVIDVHSLPETRANLVLSGDLHTGCEHTESKGTNFYNPASLARTSREERKPKACVVTISPFMDDWLTNIQDFYPECEEYPFPEKEEKIEVSKEQNSGTYVEAFEKFRSESKDIFERLDKVGREHNIEKEVLSYIQSKRKEEKDG